MSHVDAEILTLRALGENAGTSADTEHLSGCPDCQAELDRFRTVVTIGRTGTDPDQVMAPPPRVWASIAAELGDELNPGTAPVTHQPGPVKHRTWWRRPLVAGAAGLLIGAGAAVGAGQLISSPGPTVVASSTLRPLPQFPQWRDASGTAVLERTGTSAQVNITLRARSAPGFFEVWLLATDGVKMISLGDLNRGHSGLFSLPPGVNLAEYSRIDVSLQPFDGSTVHSRISVVRGAVP